MNATAAVRLSCLTLFFASASLAALSPSTHPLFEGDAVHDIYLDFAQPNWWNRLTDNFEDNDDPPYLSASFSWNDVALDSIGVRFKGNSSYFSYNGLKKSFKLDIDEFVSGQEIFGLDKLNLNNCFLDASFVREKVAYELCEDLGLAASRTNYAAVHINGTYWGLYLLVEQTDQEFLESRYGSSEQGNLWKGEAHGSFEYEGASESQYYDDYELKTNEELNDWSALVDVIDIVNNNSLSTLQDSLHNRMDVSSALAMLAIDNFIVNLDSYIGRCANYYLYHRDLDSRFVFYKWDQNEAWGVYNQQMSLSQLKYLSPFWVNPQYGEDRPLAERLWQIPAYEDVYLGHMKRLMAGPAIPDTLFARMDALRDMIRPYVEDDPNMMFSVSQFEQAMTSNVYASGGPPPGRLIPGLRSFISDRYSWLQGQIGTWTPVEDIVINEVMAANNASIADEAGDFDDWIEILNRGTSSYNLAGLGLTDHLEGTPDFMFPQLVLEPGERAIVWADEETAEGDLHAPFKLDGDGEDLYLTDGAIIVDQVTFPSLAADLSWGRWADGTGSWQLLSQATPGTENMNPDSPETVTLYINELLASNENGITDETETAEDWAEIWNPGPGPVEMGGLFLSDDLADPVKWMFPDTLLAPGAFLVVWCDSDPEDGPLHSTFKLSSGGEDLALFGRLSAGNNLIDGVQFDAQETDISMGRRFDGDAEWISYPEPTPGSSNGSVQIMDLTIQVSASQVLLDWSAPSENEGWTYRLYSANSGRAIWPEDWELLAENLLLTEWEGSIGDSLKLFRVTATLE